MFYHDNAKSRSEIDCMIEVLDTAFVKGELFKQLLNPRTAQISSARDNAVIEEPLPLHHTVDFSSTDVGFITGQVLRNLHKRYVFYAGGTG